MIRNMVLYLFSTIIYGLVSFLIFLQIEEILYYTSITPIQYVLLHQLYYIRYEQINVLVAAQAGVAGGAADEMNFHARAARCKRSAEFFAERERELFFSRCFARRRTDSLEDFLAQRALHCHLPNLFYFNGKTLNIACKQNNYAKQQTKQLLKTKNN